MTEKEKIELLEEMLELDEGTLSPETVLADLDEWDSIAAISFIALVDDEFGKAVTGADIRGFTTVADALAVMKND
ncbi:MAG: phosphopantetheine-binding protein [Candidatus Muirbacterium halophilum]|nr:phosphopantetheine-binding protein [Candidatus Muirbacterium halophilum]MCK9471878.1 phosphopantetheine-binding protein [Bacilli bacterium]